MPVMMPVLASTFIFSLSIFPIWAISVISGLDFSPGVKNGFSASSLLPSKVDTAHIPGEKGVSFPVPAEVFLMVSVNSEVGSSYDNITFSSFEASTPLTSIMGFDSLAPVLSFFVPLSHNFTCEDTSPIIAFP